MGGSQPKTGGKLHIFFYVNNAEKLQLLFLPESKILSAPLKRAELYQNGLQRDKALQG